MTTIPLLPPLHENNQVTKIVTPGQWEQNTQSSFLNNIAHGLRVVQQETNVEYLVSVPDVWARIKVVQAAFGNNRHRLHRDIVAEWRGCLALLALEEFYPYSVTASPIDLPNSRMSPFITNPGESQLSEQSFGDVVNDIMPEEQLATNLNWDVLTLLSINETPFALAVPTVLVCPRRELDAEFQQTIPWCKNGRLFDPSKSKSLQREELEILKVYLSSLLNEVGSLVPEDVDVFQALTSNLKSFLADCETALSSRRAGTSLPAIIPATVRRNGFPNHPIWRALAAVWTFETTQDQNLDTLLKTRPEFSHTIKGAVVIDEDIHESINRPPQEVRLWEINSLQRVLETPSLIDEIGNSTAKSGYLCVTPDEFFTEKLCKLAEGSSIASHHSAGNLNDFLLPFTPLTLLFISPEQLLDKTRIKKSGDSLTVSLSLSLQSTGGGQYEHIISKTFKKDDQVTKNTPDSMSFWPNFVSDNWNLYYLLYSGLLNIHFTPRLLFSTAYISRTLNSLTSNVDRVTTAKSLLEIDENYHRVGLIETQILRELYCYKEVPEAIICDAALQSEVNRYVPPSERTPIGILIPPQPAPAQQQNDTWDLGIDFGTTNTSVYKRENGDNIQEMVFENRILSPFEDADTKPLQNVLKEFFPLEDVFVPFMTIYRDRRLPQQVRDFSPVLDSHIYYVNNVYAALNDILDDGNNALKFNLKWSQQPEDRARVQLYLAQVVMQCLAEATARGVTLENINWRVSHPEAFTPRHLNAFLKIVEKAIEMVAGEDGYNAQANIERRTESLSTALYFISKANAAFTENAITIDIGGQTSDISIWQSRKLLWRSSLELAGQHILIGFLVENLELLGALAKASSQDQELADTIEKLRKLPNTERDKCKHGIEVLVNSKAFRALFDKFHLFNETDSGARLREVAVIAISGILFYVGHMIQHLRGQGIFEDRGSHMKICLGGRASQLFDTLFKTDDADQSGVLGVFVDATNGAIENASFDFSEDPKHEVAYGLLVDASGQADLHIEGRSQDLIVGEQLEINGQTVTEKSLINELDVNTEWRINDFATTEQLFDSIEKQLGISVSLDDAVKNEVIGQVNGKLVDFLSSIPSQSGTEEESISTTLQGDTILVEPVFITVLRSLISGINEDKIPVQS